MFVTATIAMDMCKLCTAIYLFLESIKNIEDHSLQFLQLLSRLILLTFQGPGSQQWEEVNITSCNLLRRRGLYAVKHAVGRKIHYVPDEKQTVQWHCDH